MDGERDYYIIRAHIVSKKVIHLYEQLVAKSKARTLILFDITQYHPKLDTYENKVNKIKDECDVLGHKDVGVFRFNDTIDVSIYDKSSIVFVTITETDCLSINKLHCKGYNRGSLYKIEAQILGLFQFINNNDQHFPSLLNMWYIEYDVYCHGSFQEVINRFSDVDTDLLIKGSDRGSAIRTKRNERRWVWWSGLEGEIANTKDEDKRGCFLPIMRMSRAFLECLQKNVGISSGFCEVYFPTLCIVNGLSLSTLPDDIFATFTYKANLNFSIINKSEPNNKLFHPLKTM
jgi:hypothetical protein